MPVWLFERFVGPDLTRMWRWLATHEVDVDLADTRAHHPQVATVEEFVQRRTRPPTDDRATGAKADTGPSIRARRAKPEAIPVAAAHSEPSARSGGRKRRSLGPGPSGPP